LSHAVTYAARFDRRSGVTRSARSAGVGLVTNRLRDDAYFQGDLQNPLLVREAMAALHAVVVSDFRFKPRKLEDRTEFAAWLADQDRRFLADTGGMRRALRVAELEGRVAELDRLRNHRRRDFIAAKARYFEEVAWRNSYELWYLLDPVVTVHPDEVSFEAFSRDESTYARLAIGMNGFDGTADFATGTTNVDFSLKLHDELERLRSYRRTRFGVAPGGFTTETTGAGVGSRHLEKKIPLPESWVNGFLQVHAASSLSLVRLELEPIDVFNLLRTLRRLGRARTSPRAVRWELVPDQPISVVLEPWDRRIELSTRYGGSKPQTIRTWGRDRLRTIERLTPVTRKVTVHLAGTGLPSFFVLDLDEGVTFTLGLSGWTDNDWTGDDKFSLLSRPVDCGAEEVLKAFETLRSTHHATESGLQEATHFSRETTRATLSVLCAAGRAAADLAGSGETIRYRHRDLFAGPFDLAAARRATRSGASPGTAIGGDRQRSAEQIVRSGAVRVIARRPVELEGRPTWKLSGNARDADGRARRPLVHVDADARVVTASCTCRHYQKHGLTQGPCEHVLALRQLHVDREAKAKGAGTA
jgi:hypothetical protein